MRNNLFQSNEIQKTTTENLVKNIENLPDIDECEYIYIDDLNIINKDSSFLKNKILITQNSLKEYLMFETSDLLNDGQDYNMTKMKSSHVVDLLILNNFNKTPNNMENLIDQDTIITKNLGNNLIYIEDSRNDLYMIITQKERFVIEGRGTRTHIRLYEFTNS